MFPLTIRTIALEEFLFESKLSEQKHFTTPKLACWDRYCMASIKSSSCSLWNASVRFVLRRTDFPDLQLCSGCPEPCSVSIHPAIHLVLPKSDCGEMC